MESQTLLALNDTFGSHTTTAPFFDSYTKRIGPALSQFDEAPTYKNAKELTLAMYEGLHDSLPSGARISIMSSGGKDSTAAVHFYVESVMRRQEAKLPFIPATILFGNTGHEFTDMDLRQKSEIEAINKWGNPHGINAELVAPEPKHTVLVELLGNGMALPPKASNDKTASANIANWCVSRVKRSILDAASKRASTLAPVVIQVFGSRYDESASRAFRMRKYSTGLPPGITRTAQSSDQSIVFGFYAIGHWTNEHIRDFVHNEISSYRGLGGNLELEKIYRDASSTDSEAEVCSIQRTQDGSFAGGCTNLFSGTRLGCMLCLKASNRALANLADKNPLRYRRTLWVQEQINRHQRLVHARPKAAQAAGFTPETCFPKGFTFRTRYLWLVAILAAEIESGERQLTDEQLDWIERRWSRHGILTVTIADARRDAQHWIESGKKEPTAFFDRFQEFHSEFHDSLGIGPLLGAYAAFTDLDQASLNLGNLLSLGLHGSSMWPQTMAYVFENRARPEYLLTFVTDEPCVLGTRTSTGLFNGLSGISLRCVAVRPPTSWELRMADGRHWFYEIHKKTRSRECALRILKASSDKQLESTCGSSDWSLEDFLGEPNTERFLANAAVSILETIGWNPPCGTHYDPINASVSKGNAIASLRGKLSLSDLETVERVVSVLVYANETLSGRLDSRQRALLADLTNMGRDCWSIISSDGDDGSRLRSLFRKRLQDEIFGHPDTLATIQEYVQGLKQFTILFHEGKVNTALATQLAYIMRTSWYDTEAAAELHSGLRRLLFENQNIHGIPIAA